MEKINEQILNKCVTEAIDEGILQKALFGSVLALSPMASAMAQSPNTANNAYTVQSDSYKQPTAINEFNVTVEGNTKEDAVKQAQTLIVNFCKSHNEKCNVITMQGYEPKIVSTVQEQGQENNLKFQSKIRVTYRAYLLLSQKYNGGSVKLTQ